MYNDIIIWDVVFFYNTFYSYTAYLANTIYLKNYNTFIDIESIICTHELFVKTSKTIKIHMKTICMLLNNIFFMYILYGICDVKLPSLERNTNHIYSFMITIIL